MVSCCTEELKDSVLLSSAADDQTESLELSSQVAMDLTSDLASNDILSDSGIPPAEPSHLVTESTDLQGSLIESGDSPSPPMGALSLPVDSLDPPAEPSVSVPAEDPPCPAPVDLLKSSAVDESTADDSPAQADEDATGSVEESAEPVDVTPAQQCSHDHDEEEPEEPHLE